MTTILRILSVALLITSGLWLTNTTQAQTPDTTRQLPVIRSTADTLPPPDSAANEMDVLVDSLAADVDTVKVSPAAQAELYKIVPKKATIRSVILPGWGQAYNRQGWKIPLVIGGFGTFAYIITTFTRNYRRYYDAYSAAAPRDSAGNYRTVTENDLRTIKTTILVNGEERPVYLSQLQSGTEFWRRWRDYNYIFAALFYGLNIVDANVSAHLKTFDVSDSLTLRYAPTVIPAPTIGLVPGIKLTLAFKK